ncbi:uncharacterized protein LOC116747315 [Phocoena sinus]|uniref:uncharacterized protein LOC116747315 n=1 Tax=Phocoena sinus TaxID=42100 RepID=UPI0013C50DCC|nr:uncharacterized protein LOC116747315 [Phocoena sinus]
MFSPYGRLFAEALRPSPLGYPAPPPRLSPGPQRSPGFLDGRSYGVPTCGGPLFAYCSSGPGPWRATTPIPAGNSTLASSLSSPDVPDVVLDFFDWPCVAAVPNSAEMAGVGELPRQGPPLHLQGLSSPQPAKTMQMKVVQKVLDRMLMGYGIHLTPHIGAGSLLSCACRDFLRETRSLKEGESTMSCLCSCSSLDHPPKDPLEGRELDSAADFKSGNVVHHLVMPKSVSFDTKESEHLYENADEEKEDGNEEPEEEPKLDMVSAEGSSGECRYGNRRSGNIRDL